MSSVVVFECSQTPIRIPLRTQLESDHHRHSQPLNQEVSGDHHLCSVIGLPKKVR